MDMATWEESPQFADHVFYAAGHPAGTILAADIMGSQRLVLHLHQTGPLRPNTDVRISNNITSYADIVVVVHPASAAANAGPWFARLVGYLVALATSADLNLPRVQFVGIERCSHADLGLEGGDDVVADVNRLLRTSFEDAISKFTDDHAHYLLRTTMWQEMMGYGGDIEALMAQVSLVTMDEFVRRSQPLEVEPLELPSDAEADREWDRWVAAGGAVWTS
jgi:hypothetical protein